MVVEKYAGGNAARIRTQPDPERQGQSAGSLVGYSLYYQLAEPFGVAGGRMGNYGIRFVTRALAGPFIQVKESREYFGQTLGGA